MGVDKYIYIYMYVCIAIFGPRYICARARVCLSIRRECGCVCGNAGQKFGLGRFLFISFLFL